MNKMEHTVLARKWRPKTFSEVIAQEHIVRTLSNALSNNQLHHAYLLTGTRGVGKTTIARILAKCLNCEVGVTDSPCGTCSNCTAIDEGRFPDLFEVDAASRTKVEDTRDLLDNVQYSPSCGRFKVYLIDEVHMLSNHSFNALLKTLEEPPEHVKFLLATTDPQKLPPTVLSRCLQFHLSSMAPQAIAKHLENILKEESIPFDVDALPLIGHAAQGSMRDSLSLLDQAISYGNQSVRSQDVATMLGLIDHNAIINILESLRDGDANALMTVSQQLDEKGAHFSQALTDLMSQLHQLAIIQTTPTHLSSDNNEIVRDLSTALSPEDVQLYYQIGLMGQRDLPLAPTPRIGFEMTLLKMLAFTPSDTELSAPHLMPTQQTKAQPRFNVESTSTPSTQAVKKDDAWLSMVPHLKLSGLTRTIANNCSLHQFNDDTLELHLKPNRATMLQDQHTKQLSEAVSTHMNKTIRVNISITDTIESITPDQKQHQAIKDKQTQQTAAIESDPQVQQLVKTFDATVLKESITSLKD